MDAVPLLLLPLLVPARHAPVFRDCSLGLPGEKLSVVFDYGNTKGHTMESLDNDIHQPHLTAREREVILTWLASDSKATAARQLHLAEPTVRAHIANVREKYIAANRYAGTKTELLLRFLEDGHFQPVTQLPALQGKPRRGKPHRTASDAPSEFR